MAFSLNGFGTKYLGKSDKHADGSYIATKWIVLAHVPVLPLQSYRMRPIAWSKLFWMNTPYNFHYVALPLQWAHVRTVYLIVLLLLAGFAAAVWTLARHDPQFADLLNTIATIFTRLPP
jgi:hypothetical protein